MQTATTAADHDDNKWFSDCPVESTLQETIYTPYLDHWLKTTANLATELDKISIAHPRLKGDSTPLKDGYVAGETLRRVTVDDDHEWGCFKKNLADAAYCDVDELLKGVDIIIDLERHADGMLRSALLNTGCDLSHVDNVDAIALVKRYFPHEIMLIDTSTGERPFFVIRNIEEIDYE